MQKLILPDSCGQGLKYRLYATIIVSKDRFDLHHLITLNNFYNDTFLSGKLQTVI